MWWWHVESFLQAILADAELAYVNEAGVSAKGAWFALTVWIWMVVNHGDD